MNKPPFRSQLPLALLSCALLLPSVAARAQNVAFDFQKPPAPPAPEKPPVEWKVQSKGGFLLTSGNSQMGNATLGLDASRLSGANKLSLNGNIAYGRTRLLVPVLSADETTTVAYNRETRTTTNQWKTRARYDRFVTGNNSVYGLAQIGADKIAGKKLMGGGQVGYSRQLLKNDQHTLVAEIGYDVSFESYVVTPGTVSIHSARAFVGELFTLTKETGFSGSVEALFNLNKEDALDASAKDGSKGVGAFKDTRIIGKLGLTTTLHKSLSLGVGFTIKYDQNPALWPPVKGAPPIDPAFYPFADKVDTLTDATLIYTFL
jgi:putative salt-induced outer membrane protein YdiY